MANKKRLFAKIKIRYRDIIALGLIFVLCAAVFGWGASAFLPGASAQYRREIVNDDYDSLSVPLEDPSMVIEQDIVAEGRLYGVRLNVATFGAVVQGLLTLDVLSESGTRVTGCTVDMAQLLDNTFHLFLFDEAVDAGQGSAYTLVLQAHKAGGPIAFHKSGGTAADYAPRDEDGQLTGEAPHYTLALQYVVRHAGGFIVTAYWMFAALLTLLLLAVYALVFIIKWPLHRLFVVCALALGCTVMFLIPPRTAPDEYVHIATAYQYSSVVLGQGSAPLLTVRAGDEMYLANYDFDATNVFAYQDLAEGLFALDESGGQTIQVQARLAQGLPLMFVPQTLGVLLARHLGLGLVPLLLLGRLGNLIFYTVLVSRAVKRMPFAKPLLFCAALLPSCLQLAASFSYDTYVLALAFYLLASCLEAAACYASSRKGEFGQGGPLPWPRLLGIGAAAALLAPGKAVYVLLVGLLLFIPLAAYKSKKARRVFLGTVALCAAALWVLGNYQQVRGNVGALLGPSVASRSETREPAAQETEPQAMADWHAAGGGLFGVAEPLVQTQDGAMPVNGVEATDPGRPQVDSLVAMANIDHPVTLRVPPASGLQLIASRANGRPYDPSLQGRGIMTGETQQEAAPWTHSDERFTPGYVLGHLPGTLQMLAASFWEQSPLWLQGLLGGRLGETIAIDLSANWLLTIGLLLALLAAALPNREDRHILAKKQRWGLAGLAAGVAALLLAINMMWTPTDYQTLFNFQGRYLLPVLPLALLALRGHSLRWQKPAWRGAVLALPVCSVLIYLDVFGKIVGRV